MQPPIPPKPPEHTLILLQSIARRWETQIAAVERVLRENGVDILPVAQKPRKGCRLSDLLAFEARWRLAMEKEREANQEAHKGAFQRSWRRKEEADKTVTLVIEEQEAGIR